MFLSMPVSDAVGPAVAAGVVGSVVWIGVMATVGEVEIVVGILLPVSCVDEVAVTVIDTELDDAVDLEIKVSEIRSSEN